MDRLLNNETHSYIIPGMSYRRLRTARTAALRLLLVPAVAGATVLGAAGCGSSGAASHRSARSSSAPPAIQGEAVKGKIKVVAAENFWGSIAAQLGGNEVKERAIITNPKVDPHSYEPSPSDAQLLDSADLVIINGIGYDEWAKRLLAGGERPPDQIALEVGELLGLHPGDNPHQWYSPTSVEKVIAAITADYIRLKPNYRSYFEAKRREFETVDLAAYHRLLAEIRSRFAGVPVGYSESIFQPMGEYLGLKLVTPYEFAKDVAEGVEVPPQLQAEVEAQAREHKIDVWIYNSQNATPGIKRINRIASAAGEPIVTITETLDPANDTFEQWQVLELEHLKEALAEAVRRG